MKQKISTQLCHYTAWLVGFFSPLFYILRSWKSLRICWDLFIVSWNDGAFTKPQGRSHMGCFLLRETDAVWTRGDAKECVLYWFESLASLGSWWLCHVQLCACCPGVCPCSEPVLSQCNKLADHHRIWWLVVFPTALILAWWKQWFTHGLGLGSLCTRCMRRAMKCFLLV